jgi:hypothetical protein
MEFLGRRACLHRLQNFQQYFPVGESDPVSEQGRCLVSVH